MTRHFTGRDLAIWIVLFFAVVISVNLLLATLARRSFAGIVAENGYVANGQFNRWLAEAAVQRWDPLESTCRHASLSIL